MSRQRMRLVPRGGTEQFEIQIACYFTKDAVTEIAVNISDPDDREVYPPLHEVLGVMRVAEDILITAYDNQDA